MNLPSCITVNDEYKNTTRPANNIHKKQPFETRETNKNEGLDALKTIGYTQHANVDKHGRTKKALYYNVSSYGTKSEHQRQLQIARMGRCTKTQRERQM
jgi:hypothetical protein